LLWQARQRDAAMLARSVGGEKEHSESSK
jgi:hypothetical protein